MIQELCQANPDWEVSILLDNRGIIIGSMTDLKILTANTDIEEE